MVQDPHRPQYHFLPVANWLNDPNGLIHWQGRYHMFYQYNPHAAQWGDIHWGHADSPDLVHWTHRPIALAPLAGGPDADGCWSGCAVDAGAPGEAAFLYTGVIRAADGHFRESACLAWAGGELEELRRDAANPVVAFPPPGMKTTGFRDHSVWKQPDGWRMAIGSGIEGQGPAALLYASADLRAWEYLGPLCAGADVPSTEIGMGTMWECPSVFFDGGQTGLIVSATGPDSMHGPVIMTGRYADPRFYPQRVEKLDYGGMSFYAPQTFRDQSGRVLMFGWLTETRGSEAQLRAGWSGAMSLPRQVRIDPQGKPRYAFVTELESLRREGLHLREERIQSGLRPLGVHSAQVEIRLELERGTAARGGLSLLRSPDGEEETRLVIDWEREQIILERSKSSLVETGMSALSAPLVMENGLLRLHLYLDGSTFECISAERTALTGRVYPARADSLDAGLFAAGGEWLLRRFDLYQLAAAW
jgi:beta-fructofuranosidase